MEEELKTFEVKFNDYGVVYVSANDFREAEEKFWKEHGGNVPDFVVKSIVYLGKGIV